jgi:hypothetical protein
MPYGYVYYTHIYPYIPAHPKKSIARGQAVKRKMEMLFVRGDGVILVRLLPSPHSP